jgi:hypothetical protein
MRIDEARPASPCFDRKPAPKLEPALDLKGLPAVDWRKANTLAAHPQHRVEAPGDERFGELRIGAILGDSAQIIVKLLVAIDAEIGVRQLLLGQIGHQPLEVFDAIVGDAHRTRRKARIAAPFRLWRGFDDEHAGPGLARRQGRAKRRVAAAQHDHVI